MLASIKTNFKAYFVRAWQESKLHPNIRRLMLYAILRECNFLFPVVILFGASRNISDADFMLTQVAFALSLLLAEPLLSPLADKYGRKQVILAGALFWILGHLVFYVAYSLPVFMLAEVILGIGMACTGAAAKALLYESFLSVNREEAHYRSSTTQSALAAYGNGVGMLIGGILVVWGINLPLLASIVLMLLMVPVALSLKETRHYKSVADEVSSYREMVRDARQSLLSPQLRWLVLLPGLITGGTITLFWSVQPNYQAAGVSATNVGFMLMGLCFVRGTFALACPRMVEHFSIRQCFAMCIGAAAAGFLSMALLPWWASYPFFVLGAGCTYVLASTMGNELLNRHLSSNIRGTALGAAAVVGRIMAMLTLGGYALFKPWLGLPVTLMLIGGLSISLSLIAYWHLPKNA